MELITEAPAVQVETDAAGRAAAVVYRTADGSQHRARGRASPRGYAGGFRLSTAHGTLGLLAMGEWLPNEDTYVDLDPLQRDPTGMAKARLHSHLGTNERRLLKHMADTTRALLAELPGAHVVEEASALDQFAPAHVLGTCRMGSDPRTSVADIDGVSHEIPNLVFADASVVPSSGSGDSPSLTIMALAVRTADRLIARLA